MEIVHAAQQRRIDTMARVSKSAVCIFNEGMLGGGSGVLIDSQGYGLTNYHVVASMLSTRKGWGGLANGRRYELEVLGIDPTGDVAMFRLIGDDEFPFAVLGDSDAVSVGDAVFAAGNPFQLSEDYAPSLSYGIVTGTHRYQWGVGTNLIYSDCLQVDAPINPGNSGGPLFNAAGEVIGINGRISINQRGRFNVGFGYAISINQIRRFIPSLRAGLVAKHGSLRIAADDDPRGGVNLTAVLAFGAAEMAGANPGDRLLTLDGVDIRSTNHLGSMLGTYPANWPVSLEIEHDGTHREEIVRLTPVAPKLTQPFVVDAVVNQRELRRTVRRVRAASFGRVEGVPPTGWKCRITRTRVGDDGADKVERFWLSADGSGSMHLETDDTAGGSRTIIEFDDESASKRVGQAGEALELDVEERIALQALYVVHRKILGAKADVDLKKASHGGVDALVWPRGSVGKLHRKYQSNVSAKSRILEVIEWPLDLQIRARLGFDVDDHLLAQIAIEDRAGGYEVTMRFRDHREIGDTGSIKLPHEVHVHGPNDQYIDVLSDWEVQR